MEEIFLRQEAARFRRLAAPVRDADLRRRLLAMAMRFETQAARLESAAANPREIRSLSDVD
jgi:hypothetical protein